MIVFDTPVRRPYHGHPTLTAHLMSDLHGEVGTEELTAFANRIGMKRRWIQYEGEAKEHFDLIGQRRITAAREAGAREISGRQLIKITWARAAFIHVLPYLDNFVYLNQKLELYRCFAGREAIFAGVVLRELQEPPPANIFGNLLEALCVDERKPWAWRLLAWMDAYGRVTNGWRLVWDARRQHHWWELEGRLWNARVTHDMWRQGKHSRAWRPPLRQTGSHVARSIYGLDGDHRKVVHHSTEILLRSISKE